MPLAVEIDIASQAELQESVPGGGGGRASQAEFYKNFYWQKSINLKKHVSLI